MKHILLLFTTLTIFLSCKEKPVDPSKRVRPVVLQVAVSNGEYKLTWEPYQIICLNFPCPDVADVEAEEYEVQIADEEIGTFKKYQTLDAGKLSTSIPVSQGEQLVIRVVSKNKGAPSVNSNPVMVTSAGLSQSAYYPGFGIATNATGGDITVDGKMSAYSLQIENAPGQYHSELYLAKLQNEQIVSRKLLAQNGSGARFSADGQQLAFLTWPDNQLIIYDISSESLQKIPVSDVSIMRSLEWSPDGKWLAYITFTEEESRLWKIATTGGAPVPLSPALPISKGNWIRPTGLDWSPDGNSIAVSRIRTEESSNESRSPITYYAADGTGEAKYIETQPTWIDSNPSFSPDGKKLAFLSTRADRVLTYSLWVRDLATNKVRQIKLLPGLIPSNDFTPRWIGNERLVFYGTQQGQAGYFSVFFIA